GSCYTGLGAVVARPAARGGAIHGFELATTSRAPAPPFYLQRGGEFIPLLGKRFGEEGKVPYPGVERQHAVDLVKATAKQRAEFGALQEGRPLLGHPVLTRQGFKQGAIGDEEGGQVRPLITDQTRFLDQRVLLEQALDVLGGDVLALRGDEQIFFAVGDGDEAFGVDLPHVTGVQPPLGVDRLRSLCRLVVITWHDIGAAHADFPVFGDLHRDLRQGRADSPEPGTAGDVAGHDRARFGEAVAFVDGEAGAVEEAGNFRIERRPAGNEKAYASTQHGAQLAEQNAVGHTVLQAQPQG